jgi:phage gp36-like protein
VITYASLADAQARYGDELLLVAAQLDQGDALDEPRILAALGDATEEIDTYLNQRYQLPLNVVPKILIQICVDIAIYRLSPATALSEEKRVRYEDAIKLLQMMATGKVSLGAQVDTVQPVTDLPDQSGLAVSQADGRLFSRTTLSGLL